MGKNQTLKVLSEQGGFRLDIFLTEKLKITRSQAQKVISEGCVLINGKAPKKMGEKVKEGDSIVIARTLSDSPAGEKPKGTKQSLDSKIKASSSDKEIASARSQKATGLAMTVGEPRIIAETPDYIVVEKPTGMLTHPTQANEKNTLVDFLIKKYPEIKQVRDRVLPSVPSTAVEGRSRTPSVATEGAGGGLAGHTYRPGIVHRLDKEASGLLVVARTQKMFDHLKQQFKNRTVEKEYWALAHGKIAKDWDEITFPIARAERSDRMAARPLLASKNVGSRQYTDEENAPNEDISIPKDARTEFFVGKRFVNFTLLKVILHTGRMHQIRVHLLAYNHPLVGDPLYNQPKRKSKWDALCGRLFLHSAKLGFTDLNGQKQVFESPLPKELEDFLATLS